MSRILLDTAILKLIDAKLALNGSITSNDVQLHTGFSRQKVSRVFKYYLEQNPNAMIYNPSVGKYEALKETFKPHFLNGVNPEVYISAMTLVLGLYSKNELGGRNKNAIYDYTH